MAPQIAVASHAPRLIVDLRGFSDAEVAGDNPFVQSTPAKPYVAAPARISEDLQCLADAVYHEARSEGDEGQRAVAQVVLNRVRHYAYPSTICAVVYQGSARSTGCQFSFTCDGSLSRRREPRAWQLATSIAGEALSGYVYAPVGLATHYHTHQVRPAWSGELRRIAGLGQHIFYRWRGTAGAPGAFLRK